MPKYDSVNAPLEIQVPEGMELVEVWGVVGFEISPEVLRTYNSGRFEPIRMCSADFATEADAKVYCDTVHPSWQATPVRFMVFRAKQEDNQDGDKD